MNKLWLLLFSVFAIVSCYAQEGFQNISFEKALKKAAKEHKLIFLQYDAESCAQCNDVANKAFADPELISTLSKKFIGIRITPTNNDRIKITKAYEMGEKSFGTLFINSDGVLIHLMQSTTSRSQDYYEEISLAEKKLKLMAEVENLEKNYFNNADKSVQELEKLIQTKKDLNQKTELLLTEYINIIPKDSLKSVRTIQFLARQSPILGSKAEKQMRSDFELFQKAWYAIELKDRIDINNRVISKSMAVAVNERNENFAKKVAHFSAGTVSGNAASRNYNYHLMNFYFRINDTTKYLSSAVAYYDDFSEVLATDKMINRADSIAKERAFRNKKVVNVQPMENGGVLKKYTAEVRMMGPEFSNTLNTAAWRFYELDKRNQYIDKALQWAIRSIEIFETPNNLDTYARLLYKTGKAEEAIKTEERAIALSRKNGLERKEWHLIVEKMKKGAPIQ